MVEEFIKEFPRQFLYQPQIEKEENLGRLERFVVGGMGGSALAGELILALQPLLKLRVWRNYGLPSMTADDASQTLFIAVSYSGNTEETIDFFEQAASRNLKVAAVSRGGKLIQLAKEREAPYIELPAEERPPRMALGLMVAALLRLMGQEEALSEVRDAALRLQPESYSLSGEKLAESLLQKIPVIYTSVENRPLAYNWKIRFNENTKIPAFYNIFPELNHNEMSGLDSEASLKQLAPPLFSIIIKDAADHPRVLKRMEILGKLLAERGLSFVFLELEGQSRTEKILKSIILADWTSVHLARLYGVAPEPTPLIEEFKRLMDEEQ
jgi:glucose/mannose-6-phosphate isomerase